MNGLRRNIANADFACAAWSKFSPPFIDPAQDADDAQNVPLGYYKTHSPFLKRPSIQITVFLRPLIHHHHHFLSVCLPANQNVLSTLSLSGRQFLTDYNIQPPHHVWLCGEILELLWKIPKTTFPHPL